MKIKIILILLLSCVHSLAFSAAKESATFAGGCFWCMQEAFDKVPGVLSTTVGYSGGHLANPTYAQVSSGDTGHLESLRIVFDSEQISYQQLLTYFWLNIDPTVKNAQFCDLGHQYRSAIFTHNPEQKKLAQFSVGKVKTLFQSVYTDVLNLNNFYPAETYHQHYYKKNPIRYKFYKWSCGRTQRLENLWTPERVRALTYTHTR